MHKQRNLVLFARQIVKAPLGSAMAPSQDLAPPVPMAPWAPPKYGWLGRRYLPPSPCRRRALAPSRDRDLRPTHGTDDTAPAAPAAHCGLNVRLKRLLRTTCRGPRAPHVHRDDASSL